MKSLLYGTLFLELIGLLIPYFIFTIVYCFNLGGNIKYIFTFLTIILIIGITSLSLCNYYTKEECKTSTIRPLLYKSMLTIMWALIGFSLPLLIPDLAMPFFEMLYNVKIPLVEKEYTLEFAKYMAHSFYMVLVLLPVSINIYFRCTNEPCKLDEKEIKNALKKLKKDEVSD